MDTAMVNENKTGLEAMVEFLESGKIRGWLTDNMDDAIVKSISRCCLPRMFLKQEIEEHYSAFKYKPDSVMFYIVSKDGRVQRLESKDENGEYTDTYIPTVEVVFKPTLPISEINSKKIWIVDRCLLKTRASIQKTENMFFASLLNKASEGIREEIVYKEKSFESTFTKKAKKMGSKKAITNVSTFIKIRSIKGFKEASQRDMIVDGIGGSIGDVQIYFANASFMSDDQIYLCKEQENLGMMSIRKRPMFYVCHDLPNGRYGFVAIDEIGMCVKKDSAMLMNVINLPVKSPAVSSPA